MHDPGVGKDEHAEWHEVLQHHDGHAVCELLLVRRPHLHTQKHRRPVRAVPVQWNSCRSDCRRQRRQERQQPAQQYNPESLALGKSRFERVHDCDVTFEADGEKGVGILKYDDGLKVGDDGAEGAAKRPVVEQDVGNERERNAQRRHENVADRKTRYEIVGDGAHTAGGKHHVTDGAISGNRRQRNRCVEHHQDNLGAVERFRIHNVILIFRLVSPRIVGIVHVHYRPIIFSVLLL